MRFILLAGATLLLGACGSGGGGGNEAAANAQGSFNEGFRSSYRPRFIESCVAGAKQAAAQANAAAAARMDFTALCTCSADKLLATKSATELMRGPSQADQTAVTQACLKEHPPTAS